VGAGVAASDDDHPLAGGEDVLPAGSLLCDALVLLHEKVHGEVNPVEFAPRNGELARATSPQREQHRVEARSELLQRHVGAEPDPAAKTDAFRFELREAGIEEPLLQLEVRDAIAKEAAGTRVTLEDRDLMTSAHELLRGGEPGRPRTHDGAAAATATSGH